MLEQLLLNYNQHPEDPAANFELALEYERQGQIGMAFSLFLRTIERESDDIKLYEALLKSALCLLKQTKDDISEKSFYQKALVLLPSRPEAYFLLSRHYESKQLWAECYTMAELGMKHSNLDAEPLRVNVDYPGKYGLYFQKGIASWWVGKYEEAKEIMADLNHNYTVAPIFKSAIENNLKNLGYPKEKVVNPVEVQPAKVNTDIFNQDKMPGYWVVDNFYKDPDAVRKFALEQEYIQGGFGKGYIGSRTANQFLFPGLKEEFEKIMNLKITAWEEHGMNGRFQYSMEGEPLVYHCDDQKWAAMLYLTPNAPPETGTSTYAIKGTDIRHRNHPEIMRGFRKGSQNLDRTLYEPVDVFGNVYNRLVIFNAGYIHAASQYFGFTKENCRLWQMFFFD
jgi:tetratricopeptide (TPR) repeat protein